jgi:hypothetical protein
MLWLGQGRGVRGGRRLGLGRCVGLQGGRLSLSRGLGRGRRHGLSLSRGQSLSRGLGLGLRRGLGLGLQGG